MSNPIGIIGVGLIGSVIAKRLHDSGYHVIGFDPNPPSLDSVQSVGSASEVFDQCDVIVLCLPDGDVVQRVLNEIEPTLREEQIIINTTTGDARSLPPQTIEATIAGSSALLSEGEATLFLGGDPELIRRAQPILDALSERAFNLGDLGAASKFKLVHNMAIGLNRAVVAETLQFAEALGFDSNTTLEILQQTPAASVAMKSKGQKMVKAEYEPPQARLSQHLKDVRLMLQAAQDASQAVPLTEAHQELLKKAESMGFGEADNAAIIEAYRKQD